MTGVTDKKWVLFCKGCKYARGTKCLYNVMNQILTDDDKLRPRYMLQRGLKSCAYRTVK